METDNNGNRNQDDSQRQYHDHRDGSEEVSDIGAANRDVSGNHIAEEGRDERRHHQQFGRKYESHKNHSSADDQPRTNTGPELS